MVMLLTVSSAVAASPARLDEGLMRLKQQPSGSAAMAPAKSIEAPRISRDALPRGFTPGGGMGLQGPNTDPGTAQYLDLNTQWSDTLDTQGAQGWYYVYVPANGKVTAFLQTVGNTSVDYDLYLYKFNPLDGTLTLQAQSFYGPAHYEQASTTATAGDYYFIMVNAYQGADPVNPYTLAVLSSNTPDSDEPDDNPWQAKSLSTAVSVTRTLDNAFDEDWRVLTVTQQNTYAFSLNTAATGTYQVQIFSNPNGAPAATVSKNTQANYQLPAGTWYVRVLSLDTVTPGTSYTLRIGSAGSAITLSSVTTDGGNGGYLNYGYGDAWRVYRTATVSGRVVDQFGNGVPNAPVTVVVYTPSTYQSQSQVSGVSQANGYFSVYVNLPAAAGRKSYDNGISMHYYDLASVGMQADLASSSSLLYHFAYSIYQPH
ncbi:carboxypeptidase-like regulatory domain-containing protein [Corallococcus aberystwythensis]|uniref:Carboxypeptidase regulatory-like domain-containing protein n=1 Tax=Corallococcus aberystwythensis TaxID=2316722 RepID=A0A3A8QUN0_9BACT|nr:carboxypeptidase-like regulatory domain-containing protein [Corallococcus aberystwythensis]RKH70095.1 carboxypeptidase regulatory-like domain-containing protein [Corallococcus aberystwythensis]